MPVEVEMKFALDDPQDIEYKLVEEGAVLIEMIQQRDHYYNHPSRDFKKTDEAFRIREEGAEIFVTYKGKKLDPKTKTRVEVNTKITSASEMDQILSLLGFQKVLMVIKERKTYELDGVHFCLDTVEGLGEFLELELIVPSTKEIPSATKKLEEKLEKLAVKVTDSIRQSYLELLLEKIKTRKK